MVQNIVCTGFVYHQEKTLIIQRSLQETFLTGFYELPGGKVDFGETMEDAIRREFEEEYGMQIEIVELLGVNDHILIAEKQHWVSPTFIARHAGGEPRIMEPEKCSTIGWFQLDALPNPLSEVSLGDIRLYYANSGPKPLQ